jgi:hypothetical protein
LEWEWGPWSRAPDPDISKSIARSQAFDADDAALQIGELNAHDLEIVLRYSRALSILLALSPAAEQKNRKDVQPTESLFLPQH